MEKIIREVFEKVKSNKTVFIVFGCFMLILILHGHYTFWLDEPDNLIGGKIIAQGGTLYIDHLAHHPPVLFYLCALFAVLGAKSVFMFRLYFYIVIFALLLIMYFRYSKYYGNTPFICLPIFYILFLNKTLGFLVLSDVLQGFLLWMLLLEVMHYLVIKKLSNSSIIIFTLTIYGSVGCAFVSIYACFIFMLIPMISELKKYINLDDRKGLLLTHIKFILILIAPLAAYILYLFIKGNLQETIFSIYTFNRTIYSKYLDFGADSALLFLTTPRDFFNLYNNSFFSFILFRGDSLLMTLLITLSVSGIYFIKKQFNLSRLNTFLIFIGFIFVGVRSFQISSEGYHGLPMFILYIFFGSFAFSYSYQNLFPNQNFGISKIYVKAKELIKNRSFNKAAVYLSIIILFFLLFAESTSKELMYLIKSSRASINVIVKNDHSYKKGSIEYYVWQITDKDDKIWTNMYESLYLDLDKQPGMSSYQLLPWYIEAWGNQMLDSLKKDQPKVIVLYKERTIWGYKDVKYGAEIFKYIDDNYVQLNPYDSTARKIFILKKDEPFWTNKLFPNKNDREIQNITHKILSIKSKTDDLKNFKYGIDFAQRGNEYILIKGWAFIEQEGTKKFNTHIVLKHLPTKTYYQIPTFEQNSNINDNKNTFLTYIPSMDIKYPLNQYEICILYDNDNHEIFVETDFPFSYTIEFRRKIVLEMMKNKESVEALSAKYKISKELILNWYNEAENNIDDTFIEQIVK